MALDKYDLLLLKILQSDSQLPLRELSEKVHLSVPSVQRRIQHLKSENYILRSCAILNPDLMGKTITAIVEVKARKTHADDLERMKQAFSGHEIQQCYYVTGESDFFLTILAANMKAFTALCDRLFHDNSDVASFKTTFVLDRIKATLDVP